MRNLRSLPPCPCSHMCVSCGGTIPKRPTHALNSTLPHSLPCLKKGLGQCLLCYRSGCVDSYDTSDSLVSIVLRVIEFYRVDLGLDLLPLTYRMVCELQPYLDLTGMNCLWDRHMLSLRGSLRDRRVQETIPIKVVGPDFFEKPPLCAPVFPSVHQLARCDCRVLVKNTVNEELCRWIDGIYIEEGLAFEALGGVLVHELMHGYMWLRKAEGQSHEFDEALCNLVSLKFLKKEASFLEAALQYGDSRWQLKHRLQVCLYHIHKIREYESSPHYYDEWLKVKKLLSDCGHSYQQLLQVLVNRTSTQTYSRPSYTY